MKYSSLLLNLAAGAFLMMQDLSAEDAEKKYSGSLTENNKFKVENYKQFSKSYGHLIMDELKKGVFYIDVDEMIQGIKDSNSGKPSPMSKEEFMIEIREVQPEIVREIRKKQAGQENETPNEEEKNKGDENLELQHKTPKESHTEPQETQETQK